MKIGVSNLPYLEKDLFLIEEIIGGEIRDIEVFLEYDDEKYHYKVLEFLEGIEEKSFNLSLHGPFRKVNLISQGIEWKKTLKSFKNAIDITRKYKGEFLVVHSNERLKTRDKNIAIEHLKIILNYAKEQGVIIALENVGVGANNLFNEEEFIELCYKFNECKVIIDVGHAIINNWNLERVIKDLNNKIVGYHLHSNDGVKDSHGSFREGILDYEKFYKLAENYTTNSKIILEYGIDKEEALLEDIEFIRKSR